MPNLTSFRTLKTLLVAAIACSFVTGCGKTHKVAQVGGKVICKNGELPTTSIRLIRFQPTADSKAVTRKGASGTINDDGTFQLYTRKPGDGVHHGDYAVTFAFFEGAMNQRSPIMAKYTSASTTPYRVVIEDDVDDFEFEIETIEGISATKRN